MKATMRAENYEITRKVDARGRVTLPEELAGSQVVIRKTGDGTYLLQELALVPKPTAWFYKNTEAQALVAKGLEDLKAGRVSEFDPDEDD